MGKNQADEKDSGKILVWGAGNNMCKSHYGRISFSRVVT